VFRFFVDGVGWLVMQYKIFFTCRNLNIGLLIKSEVQGPMKVRVCLGVKHTLTNEGECKG
jgi:hypothetical protein